MTDRDRLIELIGAVQSIGVKYTHEETASSMGFRENEELADYLLANGVIVQKQGNLLIDDEEIGLYSCSICYHRMLKAKCNYCPECGAKLKELGK